MKLAILSASALVFSLFTTSAANSAVTVTSIDGTLPGAPAPYYDFDGLNGNPAASGGGIVTHDSAIHAAPAGGSGLFYSVGPSTNSPGTLDFRNFSKIGSITFLWGSVDTYNILEILDRGLNPLGVGYTIVGGDPGVQPAGGNQSLSRLVTLTFDNPSQIGGLRLSADTNAFEIDNISFTGVPEPSVWAMMILGIGLIGGAMRYRVRKSVDYNIA